jgi:hypothetical protein
MFGARACWIVSNMIDSGSNEKKMFGNSAAVATPRHYAPKPILG